MMNLDTYREFIVFSKYLNYSKAAKALFISQSNLSKHMSKLESDLGIELVTKKGNKLLLTDAGARFLNGIQSILEEYDELLAECIKIEKHGLVKLTVQDPPYTDIACLKYYNIVNTMRAEFINVQINFVHKNFQDLHTKLIANSIDVLLEYHCGTDTNVLSAYEEKGLYAIKLLEEPMVIWSKKHLFENSQSIDSEDLKNFSIMMPSDASNPQRYINEEISDFLGFVPKIHISTASSATQFYYNSRKKSVYLLPESFSKKELIKERLDMRVVHFKDESIRCKAFIVINRKSKNFDQLRALLDSSIQQ